MSATVSISDVNIEACKARAAEVQALESRDWLMYGIAKRERQALMQDEMFCSFDYVAACKENGIDWKGSI